MLSAQEPHARAFLLDTCVLDRFCASLCDALRADDGSKRLLGEIERANLFLVPLDERGEWFRYHHVFREVLRRELEDACSEEHIAELHARAAPGSPRRARCRPRSPTCWPAAARRPPRI